MTYRQAADEAFKEMHEDNFDVLAAATDRMVAGTGWGAASAHEIPAGMERAIIDDIKLAMAGRKSRFLPTEQQVLDRLASVKGAN